MAKKIIECLKCNHSQKIILGTDGLHIAVLLKGNDEYVTCKNWLYIPYR